MLIDEFDFKLPPELIAQEPLADRQASRMMIVDRATATLRDAQFAEITNELQPGDVLVVNNTKVFPARLYGETETGAGVEIFLVNELSTGDWQVLARPGRRLKEGKLVVFAHDLSAEVISKNEDGKVIVRFDADGDLHKIVDRIGQTPLPPYIAREKGSIDADRDRYQTVYARTRGAIAAPTAGLHFTPEIIRQVREKGVEIAEVTLHVGYGTFEPVRVRELEHHKVSGEQYEISESCARVVNGALADGRRIIAIGTTTTRALESNAAGIDGLTPGKHLATLTITPGYKFRVVRALFTNFHLPKSSLLVLTSVFGGHELIMEAYRHAVRERYRFYSYGDCMLII